MGGVALRTVGTLPLAAGFCDAVTCNWQNDMVSNSKEHTGKEADRQWRFGAPNISSSGSASGTDEHTEGAVEFDFIVEEMGGTGAPPLPAPPYSVLPAHAQDETASSQSRTDTCQSPSQQELPLQSLCPTSRGNTPPHPVSRPISPGSSCHDSGQARPRMYRHGFVPKNRNLAEKYSMDQNSNTLTTTLMIRNIPNRYTQRDLIDELDELGFTGTFDFLYLPLDTGTMANVGYAFVNFIDSSWAKRCEQTLQRYRFRRHQKAPGKVAHVSVAHIQGLDANLAHYEKAAVNTARVRQRRPVLMANILQSLGHEKTRD